ncbi:Asp-tRNA(Asn)/Glu-tRNA(Gln) amidotransferase subunit GatC [Mycoplasmopsis gallinarum]
MEKITKEDIKNIVKSIYLEPKTEVIEKLWQEWQNLQTEMKWLDDLALDDLEPMTHINEEHLIDCLREDVVDYSFAISKEEALKNAKEKNDDFVLIKKVV